MTLLLLGKYLIIWYLDPFKILVSPEIPNPQSPTLDGLESTCFGLAGAVVKAQATDCHVGGCQNAGPFLDPYYNAAPDI